eukprot:TRINITY_DN37941_c0_g1_i1.p1 TRINITY_DN37941_c0_g1~~TRINITY_DN37941_c0_g1_i1.p1  ORF type:complete len:332 (-),score=86.96 TRINITY_DN37941_c0_g1_i1:110-1105(-)
MRPRAAAVAAVAVLGLVGRLALAESPGFLLISAPRQGTVSWVRLPEANVYDGLEPKTLIDSGLKHPQGIAVDQKRKLLYVADPDVQRIYAYELKIEGGTLKAGKRSVLARDAESRWVAVDGVGSVFFSDEPRNRILRVTAEQALRGAGAASEVVHSGQEITQVSEPGGVAVDNFNVYWTNKHFGTQVGSVVRGGEERAETDQGQGGSADVVSVLARNAPKAYGICLALGNIYFTAARKSVYGVKKRGGPVAEVSSQLSSPRGCAFDGDGTVYVADRDQNAVFSFAGNMQKITHAHLTKAFDVEDAFGLAVAADAFEDKSWRWDQELPCSER